MKKYWQFILLIGLLLILNGPLSVAVMQDAEELPLATRGNYHVGARFLSFIDEQRDGREIQVILWYPGVVPESEIDKLPVREREHMPLANLALDMGGAPYPVVLYSHGAFGASTEFRVILEPLVSHGFVVAGLSHSNDDSILSFVDRPMDILFVINQLSAVNEDTDSELAGLMNVDQTGVIGFSYGAYTALAVSGARVDTEAASQYGDLVGIHNWDFPAIAAYHDQFMPSDTDDQLWSAMTDPRIQAVVAYAPCDAYWFGERGLAAATLPTLLIGLTNDAECLYDWDTIQAHRHLGSTEQDLLTLVGAKHSVPGRRTEKVVRKFVTAFFGYHLQGEMEYAGYLTEDYAESFDNVVWGIDETAISDP